MKRTFEDYLIMVGIRSDEYTYTDEQIFGNTEYFKKCYNDNLSAYKALLFLHEHLQELDTSETVALHIPVVSQQSDLLLAFVKWLREDDMMQYEDKHLVDWFIKANNCG